ncbi:hypothetical protein JIN77_10405 [Verrucomicrobiaceae bacterium R5-34]|nr:hypothetical protein [Verrucomicrobiaceae bacterium R5-34]
MVKESNRSSDAPVRRGRWMRVVFPLVFLLLAVLLILAVLNAAGVLNLWNLDELKSKVSGTPSMGNQPPAAAPASVQPKVDPDPASPPAETKEPAGTPNTPAPTPEEPSIEAPADVAPAKPTPVEHPKTMQSPPGQNRSESSEGEFPDLMPPSPASSTPAPPDAVTETSAEPAPTTDLKSPPQAGSLVKDQRFLANEVLDQFLNASTLEERLKVMTQSRYTPEQLANSALAGKLKPIKSNYFADMIPRLEDEMRQYRYYVTFEDEEELRSRQRLVLQVVERPGIHPPRVNGDAFLEHYEKRLKSFGLNPTKKTTTFHCVAEARTADLAKNLPEDLKDGMIRFVIKDHPRSQAAFDAFLSKNSPMMDRIGPRADFPYVEARYCIMSFRWNTSRPDQPFIELIDIAAMGWEK